jgi:PASTA domain
VRRFASVATLAWAFCLLAAVGCGQPTTSLVPLASAPSLNPKIEPTTVATPPPPVVASLVTVPDVRGLKAKLAISQLEEDEFQVRRQYKITSAQPPGTVLSQRPKAGASVDEGTSVLLVVAKAPALIPSPAEVTTNCDSAYVGACLDPNAYDYDCAGGGGNGPEFVYVRVQVVGYDQFGLDANNDGYGCDILPPP